MVRQNVRTRQTVDGRSSIPEHHGERGLNMSMNAEVSISIMAMFSGLGVFFDVETRL